MSSSRLGDLLQICDSFSESDVMLIGLAEEPDEGVTDAELRGHARLSRLSFRGLRAAARLPRFARIAEVKRLVATTSDPADDENES